MKARRLRLDVDRCDPDDGGTPPEGEVPDPNPRPEADVERGDDLRELIRRLDRLGPREREVIGLRFGLSGDPPLTLKEIGGRLASSREWIRRIERKAIVRLAATT